MEKPGARALKLSDKGQNNMKARNGDGALTIPRGH
jgi:hypothetical protein